MAKKTQNELQAKAEELKKQMQCQKIWYVPANGHWFSKKSAAEFVASCWDCKVIEY